MRRNTSLLLWLLFVASLPLACRPSSMEPVTKKQPNIIFIMSDDHAEQAISAYGSELVNTPNIDRIGGEGIRFNNGFVTNSICAPSRAVLLTGKYSHINGLRDNRDEFDGSQMTFPKLLQQAGYQTAVVGKWHLKTAPTGFDFWKVLIGQGEYYNPDFLEMGNRVRTTGYVTTLITDFALEFLEGRDPQRPFCLLYHHKAPHRNWMPDLKHLDLFKDDEIPLPETFNDSYEGRRAAQEQDMRIADMFLSLDMKLHKDYYGEETGTGGNAQADAEAAWNVSYGRMTPEQQAAWNAHYLPINEAFRNANLRGKALEEWKYQRYMRDYLRCVVSVDENIGRLLDYLDEQDLARNTIVVYTSDQGFYLGEHGWYDKRFMYEESLSMPLLLRFPERVPAGQVSDYLVLNLDFAPTLLDFAGVEVPSAMQGKSIAGLAQGETPPVWRKSVYYHYYEFPHGWHNVKRHYGIRTDRFKLIHFYNDIDEWELFDLEADPQEMNNLFDHPDYSETQADLLKQLRALQRFYQDEIDTSVSVD